MSAREMQLLMQEVANKERSLAEVSSEPPWWLAAPATPAPTSEAWWPVTLTVVLVGCLTAAPGLAILIGARFVTPVPTAGELRQVVGGASEIPWRHYVGKEQDQRCDVWVSVLGLAEAECDGKTVYRGFGVVDHDGSFRSLPLVEDTRFDHDVQRSAIIDVRRREAHFGALETSAWLAIGVVDITGLQDQSLVEPPAPPVPPDPSIDLEAAIRGVFRAHDHDLNHCDSFRGRMAVLLNIDVSGKVTDVTIYDSTLPESVDRCVTTAVRSWKFPAMPADYQTEIPVIFTD